MRELIALALVLVSTAAGAEDWAIVRKPTDPGQAGLPSILVDSASIVVLNNGIRRASVKMSIPGQRDRRFRRNVTGRSGAT